MKLIFIMFLSSIHPIFSSGISSDIFERDPNSQLTHHRRDMDSTSCGSISSKFNSHKVFETIPATNCSHSEHCYNHGSLLWGQGKKKEAINTWWIAANLGHVDALFNIALAHTWPHEHSAFFDYAYGYSLLSDLSAKGHINSIFEKAKLDFLNPMSSRQEKINAVKELHDLHLKGHLLSLEFLDEIKRDLSRQTQSN